MWTTSRRNHSTAIPLRSGFARPGHDQRAFARYGVDAARRDSIVANFADWAEEIDS
jgi:hypothetical protein